VYITHIPTAQHPLHISSSDIVTIVNTHPFDFRFISHMLPNCKFCAETKTLPKVFTRAETFKINQFPRFKKLKSNSERLPVASGKVTSVLTAEWFSVSLP
jgi:hypothetical protein